MYFSGLWKYPRISSPQKKPFLPEKQFFARIEEESAFFLDLFYSNSPPQNNTKNPFKQAVAKIVGEIFG
jgi:hypothetical protein